MMTRLNRILSLLMVLTVPVFLTACEDDDRDIDDQGEFGTETEGLQQPTTPMEGTGTFASWDTDADGALTQQEFRGVLTQQGSWTRWDTDGNTSLNQQEFDMAFSDRDWYEDGIFTQWDTDGNGELSRDEWETGLFDALDENNDNRLQEDEFDADLFRGTMGNM